MWIEAPSTEDTDALCDLWVELACGQRAYGSHLYAEENREIIREAIVRDIVSAGLLVARGGTEEIVGFVMFGPAVEHYTEDASRGVVRNIVVRPERRNEGIGSELLAAAESALSEKGFDTVSLSVLAANDAAQRFYARSGYVAHRIDLEKPLGESDSHKPDRG